MAKPSELQVIQGIVEGLVKNNITPLFDGPSIILMDKHGNKVIDISNGLGPVGKNLTMLSKLQESSNIIKKFVKVPISDNQFLALASFCSHIGPDNFIRSNVLRWLNKEFYADIPKMLLRWRTGQKGESPKPEIRVDFMHRRQFESELFTTPDIVKIDFGVEENENKLTWKQLTLKLRRLTRKAFQELQARQAKGELLEYSDISNLIQLKAKLDNPGDDIVIGAPVNPGDNPGDGLVTPQLPTAY
tara:strand:- start:26863 stop:27597 length:735 start_codon:yes stop_codon:yes gene_type:complete